MTDDETAITSTQRRAHIRKIRGPLSRPAGADTCGSAETRRRGETAREAAEMLWQRLVVQTGARNEMILAYAQRGSNYEARAPPICNIPPRDVAAATLQACIGGT